MTKNDKKIENRISKCKHCGEVCLDDGIIWDDLEFCCNGCQLVFQLLKENGLQDYYNIESQPGISQSQKASQSFEYLDDVDIKERLIGFREGGASRIVLELPQIHCSSCLWLLENLPRLHSGIKSSIVNFHKKTATIVFSEVEISLRELVELLTNIGYEPRLNFESLEDRKLTSLDRSLMYKLGLAGFSFGNVMLLSFPEYLGFHQASAHFYIGYFNVFLATPVFFYSGSYFLKSAYKGMKIGHLSLDVPVAIGMIVLFSRSIFEILSQTGEGYLDSFTGFVFFLLIGRWFQNATYQSINFDRNYKSYFPISVLVKKGQKWISVSLDKLTEGQIIMIRNGEIIPSDGVLIVGKGKIDYSFVTGESEELIKTIGDKILAGGKQLGQSIELQLISTVDQSYLTQLWKEDAFKKERTPETNRLIDSVSKYFTYVILIIAVVTFLYWYFTEPASAFKVVTAVLIVACPCALALSIPFTFGNMLRILSKSGFYLKNTESIERIQDINHIVFDKTGTLTDSTKISMSYQGESLDLRKKELIYSICLQSNHPLSRAIVATLEDDSLILAKFDDYKELFGKGIEGSNEMNRIRVGSEKYIKGFFEKDSVKGVYVEINGKYQGVFVVHQPFRKGIKEIISSLSENYILSMVSGDSEADKSRIKTLFVTEESIYFNQTPAQKMALIRKFQERGDRVMMVGDGLNDAGALRQSDVGIVVSDQANNFSPACDGIIKASEMPQFLKHLNYLNLAKWMIYGAFVLAFLYNTIGLFYAISGSFSPIVAAILMPLSSISTIAYGLLISNILKKYF